jgi:hypothetical protein
MTVLQTVALPLGYAAGVPFGGTVLPRPNESGI